MPMSVDLSGSILSPSLLLWLAGVLLAAILLLSLMNRRRTKLTESLRDFVDQSKTPSGESPPSDNDRSE